MTSYALTQLKELHTQYLAMLASTPAGTARHAAISARLAELTAQIKES